MAAQIVCTAIFLYGLKTKEQQDDKKHIKDKNKGR
jgi:hypothetical protein